MKLSILIPAFNEEKTITQIIEKAKKAKSFGLQKEIIAINDASTDATAEILEKTQNIKVIKNKKNFGKGYSVRAGIRKASGNFIIIQDADLEYNPADYEKLLKPLIENQADVVFGSRTMKKTNYYSYKLYYHAGNFLSTATNLLYGAEMTDITTGFKAFKKNVMEKFTLKENGFAFEAEFTAKTLKNKIKTVEVPITYTARKHEDGKKIMAIDGFKMLFAIVKYRFVN